MSGPNHFPGDTDTLLHTIQRESYPTLCQELYSEARQHYLTAANLVGHEDAFVTLLKQTYTVDPAPLLPFLEITATHFRRDNPQSRQFHLQESLRTHQIRLQQDWYSYARSRHTKLLTGNEYVRMILESALHPIQDQARRESLNAYLAEL